jgi:vacuolar-type H+-ATPase subunit E/Vma4
MKTADAHEKGNVIEGTQQIVTSIDQEAREEIENLLSAAKQEADRRLLYAENQAESIIREAEERAKEQIDTLRTRILSGISVEVKRKTLHIREQLYDEVLQRATEMLEALMEKDEYREILLNLITEAAVGLGVSSMTVNATGQELELIDRQMLDEAEKRIERYSGKKIRLQKSTAPPLKSQGVLLSSDDNRVTYNNQMKTRMARKQMEIRSIVHEQLFEKSLS